MSSRAVTIELSAAQVGEVVRATSDTGDIAALRAQLIDMHAALAGDLERMRDSRMSGSLLVGLVVLASFPPDGSQVRISELARTLSMNPSTLRRYVLTLASVGLLGRDPRTRGFRLT